MRRCVPQAIIAAQLGYLAAVVVITYATSVVHPPWLLVHTRLFRRVRSPMRALSILSRAAEKLAESRRRRAHGTQR